MEKNLKKALALLTAIAIVGGANYVPQNENFSIKNSMSVSAESINGELSYEVVGEEVVITGVNGEPKNIIIPEEIEGYPVTSIGEYAFEACSSLVSIVIPDSVTSIGGTAFLDCSGLASIDIPNSVTSIGRGVFAGCISLTSIVIPNSVTSIGERYFYGCESLESIVIPDSVTSIGEMPFSCRIAW